jgi:thiopeptide-type bacteriocin biosynthesis protein
MLRAGVDSAGHAILTEAPSQDGLGWFGGRAHEIVTALTAAHPATWPALPPVAVRRVIGRDHGLLPGNSATLMIKVYGHADRADELLAEHLPLLWSRWDVPPRWWYLRYRDPDPHLRLRITLADTHDIGAATGWISDWAGQLRRQGLLRDIQFATAYPETGRWGSGPVMDAAEDVFAADSRALLVQLGQHPRLPTHVLAAANCVAIARAFTGSTVAGMRWLINHATITPSTPLDRENLAHAVRVSDPAQDWAALRAAPGGPVIAEAWPRRDLVLSAYRGALRDAEGIDPDTVLDSLLHAHFLRGVGIDRDQESTCLRLARAAALAWTAQHSTAAEDTTC